MIQSYQQFQQSDDDGKSVAMECTRAAGCTCPLCDMSASAMVEPKASVECTRAAGCACPQCDMSAAVLDDGCAAAAEEGVAPDAAAARPLGWQERDAYGIADPTPEEVAADAPYLLVCHPRPEILGMCYREVEKYLRTHRGWKRNYSKNGNPKPGTGPETGPWDLMLGGNKAKRVPFMRMSEHRSYNSGGQSAVNYFAKYELLDNKDQLAVTLRKHCARVGVPMHSLMPETHPFQPDSKRKAKQLEAIVGAFQTHAELAAARPDGDTKNIWILKQSELNQGKGCVLMDDLDAITAFLGGVAADAGAWVVQQYVHRPLLYVGERKFDIRCWVVVKPDFTVLMYKEGVLRVGAASYDLDDIGNIHAHLSNHCLAVGHADYGKYEATNELWYSQFDTWLQSTHEKSFEDVILPQIREITVHTMLSAKDELENSDPAGAPWVSFQLWGLDYMVDADFNVQLLEANVSPACADALLPQFGEDFVHTVLDPQFRPADEYLAADGTAERHVVANAKGGGDSSDFKRGFETLWSPGDAVPGLAATDPEPEAYM